MTLVDATLDKVQPISVASQVAATMREAILAGRFKPAERLIERRLAESMGVSLASVRNALQQLEHEGLVTKKPNTATHVTEVSKEGLRDMMHVRLLLEPSAMALASRRMLPEGAAALQELVNEIDRHVSANDFFRASRADFRFHEAVWQLSGNETMARMLTQLCTPFFAFLMILMSVHHQNLQQRIISHQPLLDILLRGDPAEVENAAREHIRSSWHPFLDEA